VYHQASSSEHYGSDTDQHIQFVYRVIFDPHYHLSYPLWHYLTYSVHYLFHIDMQHAAAFVSASLVSLWTALVYYVAQCHLPTWPLWKLALLSILITVIGPLCIPWYRKLIFLGQGSPNIWHNVTLLTVKPFALLTILFLLNALKDESAKYYYLSLLAALISIVAKPSFIIDFIPALILFALLTGTLVDKHFRHYLFLLVILSSMILTYQFLHTFYHAQSHIIFDWLGVWSLSSPNIPVSILLALAFPLVLTFLHSEVLKDGGVLLSWLMIFIGMLYYMTLAQSGRFYSHGNFGWSYMISLSLLYLYAIIIYFQQYMKISQWKHILLNLILILQGIIGVYYFVKTLEGQNPLYISIYF
jgi:hypothetical protein